MKDRLTVEIFEDGKLLKKYLSEDLNLSRRTITRLYQTKGILINNKETFLTYVLNKGDILDINFTGKDVSSYALNNNDIDILYEDEYLLAVDKPSGILAHKSYEHEDKDLSIILKKKYGEDFILRSIGRLDKDVSGIMLLAKDEHSAYLLNKDKENNNIKKYYSCLVNGYLKDKKGTINIKLIKDEKNKCYKVSDLGKSCLTNYEVIKEKNNLSLLNVEILTGRTHQIRCSMKHIGHTIVGDIKYGDNHHLLNRIGLHCSKVIFKHPYNNKEIIIESKLPSDIEKLID